MMGKGTRKRATRAGKSSRAVARPRSLSATDQEWNAVEQFALRRGFASTSDAARRLLRSGLHTEQLVEELAVAQEWQLAQAWADAQAIANGDRGVGSWDSIAQAAERARNRIRERAATQRAVMTGT